MSHCIEDQRYSHAIKYLLLINLKHEVSSAALLIPPTRSKHEPFYRPLLFTFFVALAVACVWVSQRPHHVAAAPPPDSALMAMPHHHSQTVRLTSGMIDGSATPQLIPDTTAYRLFFLVASDGGQSPTPDQASRRSMVLHSAHVLRPSEETAATTILVNFRSNYMALIAKYNLSVQGSNDTRTAWANFVAQRNALVQSTRGQLAAALSAATMSAFNLKVQAEKVHMKAAESEANQ